MLMKAVLCSPGPISAFPQGKVHAGELLSFLEARVHYSDLEPGHWLLTFRNYLNTVLAYLFDVGMYSLLEENTANEASLEPTRLVGPSGVKRTNFSLAKRKQQLDKLEKLHGSPETLLRAMSLNHGFAGLLNM